MADKDLYKKITKTVPEFFFIYNLLLKKISFVSPQFLDIVETTHHKGLRSYIHPEHQAGFDLFFEGLSSENNYTSRIEFRAHQDLGNIKWVEINTFPVEGEEQGQEEIVEVVGHIVDITEKKERIALLEDEQEKLDSVLKILAHDLRAPFSQVHMISDILQNLMNEEEKRKFGRYIRMLHQLGNRSLTLLDSLLRLVALQEGTLSLELKKQDLRHLIKNVLKRFKVNMQEKQINCVFQEPDFAVVGEVDVILLEQALGNIISNSIKFTPNKGEIFLYLHQHGNEAKIEVEDTGIGIPEKHIPDLFKEFSKIRRKGLNGEKSTGLGLSITKQILKLHKGQIMVKSQENKGSHFTIVLPLG